MTVTRRPFSRAFVQTKRLFSQKALTVRLTLPNLAVPMIAKTLVHFYRLVHGRLHLRGAGAMLKIAARWLPGLQNFPYQLPGIGIITLDFRDASSCGMVNFSMGELEPNVHLFALMEHCLPPH